MNEQVQTSHKNLTIFWFRRDLRLNDNKGLYYALKDRGNVLPLFIFDTDILDHLDSSDPRVDFIYREIQKLQNKIQKAGSVLLVEKGKPLSVFKKLIEQYSVSHVFYNRDYEPYATDRDQEIKSFMEKNGIQVHAFKDQVIAEKDDILKKNEKPYTVFTPYMKKWKEKYNGQELGEYPADKYLENFIKTQGIIMPTLKDIGFEATRCNFPERSFDEKIIKNYHNTRNYPAIEGTSKLSIHFRFGTLSIREAFKKAFEWNETWLNELIWRDFYMMILWFFPDITDQSFKTAYDKIEWRNNEEEFDAWCRGKTGYPIVDAGMRELNQTGYMHNRLRMITASFLTKHLLIDWRWGESYFAEKLLDYELSSNNGGWQWAAGSGCDAAPYFRIFNPYRQTERFDPELKYINKWVPEKDTDKYPKPITDHKFARERALKTYKRALKQE
jgi:deoxyribodipyrimidine photo-lyase